MVFPVVMYGCESWTIKKAEHWRIDAFELWSWRRVLRVPWTARRSNQSILKETIPEYSLEGLMLKLKLQYFGHLMGRTDSLEKTLMLGKIEGRRRRDDRGWDGWMASLTRWAWVWASSGSWWWVGKPGVLQSVGSQSWTLLNDWTEQNFSYRRSNDLSTEESFSLVRKIQTMTKTYLVLRDRGSWMKSICKTPMIHQTIQWPGVVQTGFPGL